MLPDLRLLITAIVVTFLLAAAAGLYASLRVTQEQIAARADVRASFEENPIMRITNSWPLPEPSRAAALRDLTKLPSGMPIVAATEPEPAPERSETQVVVEMPQPQPPITPPVIEPQLQIAAREITPPEITHSTGIATSPDKIENAPAPATPAMQPADQPDVHGNAGSVYESAKPRTVKGSVTVYKKPAKRTRTAARKRKPAPLPVVTPFDQLITGYPLYLTVPVTN